MTTAEFHPRAASLALAKLIADESFDEADLLTDGLNPDELGALLHASAELLYGLCHDLAKNVRAIEIDVLQHEEHPDAESLASTACVFAGLCGTLQSIRVGLTETDDPDDARTAVVEAFDRALAHQLIEHPDGDEGECDEIEPEL